MKLFWQWTANTSFRVDWGTSTSYGSSSPAVSAYDSTNHLYAYTITEPDPQTPITNYRVVVGSQYSAGSFLTAAGRPVPLRSISSAMAITAHNPSIQNTVAGLVDKLFQSDPSYQTFNLVCGDLIVQPATPTAIWTSQMFSSSLSNIRTELANLSYLPVMGNHEGSGSLFLALFPPAVCGGGILVVRLWPGARGYDGPVRQLWLRLGRVQLGQERPGSRRARSGKWLCSTSRAGRPMAGMRTTPPSSRSTSRSSSRTRWLWWWSGHNHYYARAMVNGIPELTLGTGGAPLYSPAQRAAQYRQNLQRQRVCQDSLSSGSTLTGTFISSSGSTIDTFSVTRQIEGRRPSSPVWNEETQNTNLPGEPNTCGQVGDYPPCKRKMIA